MRQEYFNLAIPAPKRLAMMRADFTAHATKYPQCPEYAKPKSWRDMRGTTHKGLRGYIGNLDQGFNDGAPIWYCHTGEQFRGEKFADECIGGPKHTGWFTDRHGDEKARGIVGRLPHGRFIAGYWWGNNGERVYYPEVFDGETDAARMADEHARIFAESAREALEQLRSARDVLACATADYERV